MNSREMNRKMVRLRQAGRPRPRRQPGPVAAPERIAGESSGDRFVREWAERRLEASRG